MGRKRIPTSPASPFYGYPAEVIAEWCGVSIGTAKHYKSGRRKPPTPVLRLFRLYRDGKVLGSDWENYRAIRDKLIDQSGQSFTPSNLALYGLVWQALASKDPESYYALLRKASSM